MPNTLVIYPVVTKATFLKKTSGDILLLVSLIQKQNRDNIPLAIWISTLIEVFKKDERTG